MVVYLQKDKPFLLHSLFLRIRDDADNTQLSASAHIIRCSVQIEAKDNYSLQNVAFLLAFGEVGA